MKLKYFSKKKGKAVSTTTDSITLTHKGGSLELYVTASGKLRIEGLSYETGSAFKFLPCSAHSILLEMYDSKLDLEDTRHKPIRSGSERP